MDRLPFAFGDQQRLAAAAGLEHRVAVPAEDPLCELAHGILVLDQQDRLVGVLAEHEFLRLLRGLLLLRLGQVDLEGRAPADPGIDIDMAAELLDDAMHRREPQPRALARGLGGVERLEDARLCLGVHAAAGVLDDQSHMRPGLESRACLSESVAELDIGGLDRQLPALQHGIAGIDREVHQDLLQLADVGEHGIDVGALEDLQPDVLADQSAQHRLHLAEHPVEIEYTGLQHLLATEGQQLAGQLDRTLAALVDLLQLQLERGTRTELGQQQIAVAIDHRQHVVEVVRHPAGQPPHRLHFLRMAKLLGERLLAQLSFVALVDHPGHAGQHLQAVAIGRRVSIGAVGQHDQPDRLGRAHHRHGQQAGELRRVAGQGLGCGLVAQTIGQERLTRSNHVLDDRARKVHRPGAVVHLAKEVMLGLAVQLLLTPDDRDEARAATRLGQAAVQQDLTDHRQRLPVDERGHRLVDRLELTLADHGLVPETAAVDRAADQARQAGQQQQILPIERADARDAVEIQRAEAGGLVADRHTEDGLDLLTLQALAGVEHRGRRLTERQDAVAMRDAAVEDRPADLEGRLDGGLMLHGADHLVCIRVFDAQHETGAIRTIGLADDAQQPVEVLLQNVDVVDEAGQLITSLQRALQAANIGLPQLTLNLRNRHVRREFLDDVARLLRPVVCNQRRVGIGESAAGIGGEELQHAVADDEQVPMAQRLLADHVPVEHRAVGAAEILQQVRAVGKGDLAVEARDGWIVEPDLTTLAAAQTHEVQPAEVPFGPEQRPFDDLQLDSLRVAHPSQCSSLS